jgi:hypothetical protein
MHHTPEPWVKDNFDILGPKGETLLVGMHRDEKGSLDLKRAVACVNACAGLNPEHLREFMEAAKELRKRPVAGSVLRFDLAVELLTPKP